MNRRILFFACLLTFANSAVLAQGAASPAASPGSAKAIDLDKLLIADEEGDLLTEEKPAAVRPVIDSAAGRAPAKAAEGRLADDGANSADSGAGQASSAPPGRRGPPPGTAEPGAADMGPAIVEEGRTINFAQNLKEYKSPRMAMLLSLLVPGLGQAYSRSYVKASAFGAAEIAAIGVAVYFNSVAKAKKKEAYNFADEHFDINNIKVYDDRLRDAILAHDPSIEVEKDSLPLPYDQYFYDAAGSNSAHYYESIRGKDFTPGWKDGDPPLNALLEFIGGANDTIEGLGGSLYVRYYDAVSDNFYYIKRIFDGVRWAADGGGPVLGYSSSQNAYNEMMDKSNSYRDAVNYMFYVMLLNHIASAIDAGFTARAHNARLLGEGNSAWNRLSVEQRFVFTGSGLSPGVALRWRF